ncbi:MAG: sugar phosphate isomerase/epimerase [Candidatus Micrarchaeota archaeon]
MLLGAMNNQKNDILREARAFGELGFEFLELTIEAPEANPEKILKKQKQLLDELSRYKMKLLAHAPWFLEITHPYPRVREAMLAEMREVVETTAKLEIEKLTIHTEPQFSIHAKRETLVSETINSIKTIHKWCVDSGVVLCVENFTDASFSLEEFKKLFSEVPELKFTLDVGHANLIKSNGAGITDFLRAFKNKLAHLHAHDNNGKEDLHLPIGAGKINWEKIIPEIRRAYDGTITLEIHSDERAYLGASREKFLKLWAQKGE